MTWLSENISKQHSNVLRIIVAKSPFCGKICATIYFCIYIYCKRCIDIAITTRHKQMQMQIRFKVWFVKECWKGAIVVASCFTNEEQSTNSQKLMTICMNLNSAVSWPPCASCICCVFCRLCFWMIKKVVSRNDQTYSRATNEAAASQSSLIHACSPFALSHVPKLLCEATATVEAFEYVFWKWYLLAK